MPQTTDAVAKVSCRVRYARIKEGPETQGTHPLPTAGRHLLPSLPQWESPAGVHWGQVTCPAS